MKATKIRMNKGFETSNNAIDIKEIYIVGCSNPGWFSKETLHDHLKKHPKSIQVDIAPFSDLFPVVSGNNEKYVRSEPNDIKSDNLLQLPRV